MKMIKKEERKVMNKEKESYLVQVVYEHKGIILQSISVMGRKQLKKIQKKSSKYFDKERTLNIKIGVEEDSILKLTETDLREATTIQVITNKERKVILDNLGIDFGPLNLYTINDAFKEAKRIRKEQPDAE